MALHCVRYRVRDEALRLAKTQFLVLSQVIIFLLGCPLEWAEIVVTFMPIFIPLLDNVGLDP